MTVSSSSGWGSHATNPLSSRNACSSASTVNLTSGGAGSSKIDVMAAHLKTIGAEDMDPSGVYKFNSRRDLQIAMPSLVVTFNDSDEATSGAGGSSGLNTSVSMATLRRSRASRQSKSSFTKAQSSKSTEAKSSDSLATTPRLTSGNYLSAREIEAAYRQAIEHKQQAAARHPFSAPPQLSKSVIFLPHDESAALVARAQLKAQQASLIEFDPSKSEAADHANSSGFTSSLHKLHDNGSPEALHYTASEANLLALPTSSSTTNLRDLESGLNMDGIRMLQHQQSRAKAAMFTSQSQAGLELGSSSSSRALTLGGSTSSAGLLDAAVGDPQLVKSLASRFRPKRGPKKVTARAVLAAVESEIAAYDAQLSEAQARAEAKRKAAALVKAIEEEAYQEAEQAIQMRERLLETEANALGANADVIAAPRSLEDEIDDLARLAGLLGN